MCFYHLILNEFTYLLFIYCLSLLGLLWKLPEAAPTSVLPFCWQDGRHQLGHGAIQQATLHLGPTGSGDSLLLKVVIYIRIADPPMFFSDVS